MRLESWDDLRLVLAVARGGTLTAAANRLGVDQTTVTRRLKALEAKLGMTLFDRMRGGVELSETGEAFVAAAEALETRVLELERTIEGGAELLTGRVRLTMGEYLIYAWLRPLTEFARQHPGLDLELVGGNEIRNLTRREADVAVRMTSAPSEHLVGRRITRVALGMYGHERYAGRGLGEVPWIGWDPDDSALPMTERYRQELGGGPYALFVNTYLLLLEATRQGAGVALLPCIVGDREPGLVRVGEVLEREESLWVLTHPDLRRSARIKAVMHFLGELVSAESDALLGRPTARA